MSHAEHRSKRPKTKQEILKQARVDADFWRHKTIDELAKEQGVGPITDPDEVIGKGADLWSSDEELDEFLEDIRRQRGEGGRA